MKDNVLAIIDVMRADLCKNNEQVMHLESLHEMHVVQVDVHAV